VLYLFFETLKLYTKLVHNGIKNKLFQFSTLLLTWFTMMVMKTENYDLKKNKPILNSTSKNKIVYPKKKIVDFSSFFENDIR
jgi:hypothetical protein